MYGGDQHWPSGHYIKPNGCEMLHCAWHGQYCSTALQASKAQLFSLVNNLLPLGLKWNVKSELINMRKAPDKEKIWVPDSNWTGMTSQTPGNVLSTELRCMRTHGEQSFNLVHMRRASYTLLGSTLLKSLLNIKAKNFKLGNEMWKVNWSAWHNQVGRFNFASPHLGNCVHEKKSAAALIHACWNDSL